MRVTVRLSRRRRSQRSCAVVGRKFVTACTSRVRVVRAAREADRILAMSRLSMCTMNFLEAISVWLVVPQISATKLVTEVSIYFSLFRGSNKKVLTKQVMSGVKFAIRPAFSPYIRYTFRILYIEQRISPERTRSCAWSKLTKQPRKYGKSYVFLLVS